MTDLEQRARDALEEIDLLVEGHNYCGHIGEKERKDSDVLSEVYRIAALASSWRMVDALEKFERVTRLADTLASDVPITSAARQHITNAYAALADMLALASSSVPEQDSWQPIETAPKDGTEIDVWIPGEFPGRRPDVQWREPTDSEWWAHGGDTIETPDATWHDCFGPFDKFGQPTHWMPRPAPPAVSGLQDSQQGSGE